MFEDDLLAAQTCLQYRDHQLAQRIIKEAGAQLPVGQRMKLISNRLLGSPYLINPLVGSATEPEAFVATLSGFDCVTFMETVLALAWAKDVAEFLNFLREIRYQRGEVCWQKRHHYTTDWARVNIRRGFLSDLTRGEGTVLKTKILNLVPGLRPRRASFRYFPKRKLGWLSRRLADGDLIFFVSTRKGLDVFHTGLVFRSGRSGRDGENRDPIILRHAARSRGGVVEQELSEFVRSNRMPGVIVVRPRERPRVLAA